MHSSSAPKRKALGLAVSKADSTIALYAAFAEAMEQAGPFEASPVIAVAVSGGSDSLALVLLAARWAARRGGRVVALTVDHRLRAEARAEAETVQHWLAQVGITHHILAWDYPQKPRGNIQAEARNARYTLLAKWCRAHEVLHLLVAHHLDDVAESFMLRLQRGSGVDGLAAMPVVHRMQDIRLIRPLLSVTKQQLQCFLQERGQSWVEDPSNQNLHYTRNHIRQFLAAPFAQLPPALFTARLAECAKHMGRARIALEEDTACAMVKTLALFPEGYATLERAALAVMPEEIALRVVAAMLTTISGHQYRPRFDALMRLYHAIISPAAFTTTTLWGCVIQEKDSRLLCIREYSAIEREIQLAPGIAARWDNRFTLAATVSCTVSALGYEGWQRIKEQCPAVLLPKAVIITLPAFKSLESVIAVPHINFYSKQLGEHTHAGSTQVMACFAPQLSLTGGAHRGGTLRTIPERGNRVNE